MNAINIPKIVIDRGPETPPWAMRLQVDLDNTINAVKSENTRLTEEIEALKARVFDLENP